MTTKARVRVGFGAALLCAFALVAGCDATPRGGPALVQGGVRVGVDAVSRGEDGGEATPEPGVSQPADGGDPGLVAHEWGTFTSVQGSDGVTLEGLHHEDEPLPPFVHGRCSSMPSCLHPDQKSVEEIPEGVTQKLETPVIYFHSAQARQISVEVDFPSGIISQWYPAVAAFQPPLGDMEAIAGGSMRWQVAADPALDRALAPPVSADGIWAPSRRTAATPLAAGGEHESFIFYRGVGRFEMPVRATSEPGGTLHIANVGDAPLPAVFLMRTEGDAGAILALGALPAGARVDAAAPAMTPGHEAFVAEAKALLASALTASGLYEDEARAMVDTWERSWFGTSGTRVLYVVPRAWTDALLPMRIEPAPAELVRTLIGRIEVLSVAEEQATVAQVEAAHQTGTPLSAGPQERFFEPRLRRACALLAGTDLSAYCAAQADHAAGWHP